MNWYRNLDVHAEKLVLVRGGLIQLSELSIEYMNQASWLRGGLKEHVEAMIVSCQPCCTKWALVILELREFVDHPGIFGVMSDLACLKHKQ